MAGSLAGIYDAEAKNILYVVTCTNGLFEKGTRIGGCQVFTERLDTKDDNNKSRALLKSALVMGVKGAGGMLVTNRNA